MSYLPVVVMNSSFQRLRVCVCGGGREGTETKGNRSHNSFKFLWRPCRQQQILGLRPNATYTQLHSLHHTHTHTDSVLSLGRLGHRHTSFCPFIFSFPLCCHLQIAATRLHQLFLLCTFFSLFFCTTMLFFFQEVRAEPGDAPLPDPGHWCPPASAPRCVCADV